MGRRETIDERAKRLLAPSRKLAQMPILDRRSADEILGYKKRRPARSDIRKA